MKRVWLSVGNGPAPAADQVDPYLDFSSILPLRNGLDGGLTVKKRISALAQGRQPNFQLGLVFKNILCNDEAASRLPGLVLR